MSLKKITKNEKINVKANAYIKKDQLEFRKGSRWNKLEAIVVIKK
jgi:hypothetical protein